MAHVLGGSGVPNMDVFWYSGQEEGTVYLHREVD